ncbi:MAG: CoA transferase, partial [Caldilineaceae bacterium]|nr:CoA transferase [Caldilineaceae bacterium]
EDLIPALESCFRQRTAQQWRDQLLEAGVPCSPVNDIPSALADPQAQARGMVQQVEHPVTGVIPLIGPTPKLSLTPAAIASPPPLLGEHTDQILREFLGYSEDQIGALHTANAL